MNALWRPAMPVVAPVAMPVPVLIAALIAAIGLAGCDQGPPPPAIKAPPAKTSQPPSATAPAPAPAKARWPFASGNSAVAPSGFDPVAAIRRNYYVVFDASGSMAQVKCSGEESKLTVAKRAVAEFAEKLPADVNLGLMVFDNSGIRQLIALSPLQRGAAARAIDSIRAGGGTPLAESIRQGYAALTEQGRRQFGYGEFHLVVVTDGEATGENPQAAVNTLLASSPVVLHTIGFCIGDNHSLNQPGRVVYRAADNPTELAQGLAEVLAESPSFNVKAFK